MYSFIFPKVVVKDPIKGAMLFFTGGSANERAVYVLNGRGYIVQTAPAPAQIVELQAAPMVFQLFVNSLFNLYTDSYYIFGVLQVIETVPCIGTNNGQVRMLFQQIQDAIQQRKLPCFFVDYIVAHSSLPGPLMDGNASADKLTSPR